MTIDSKTGVIKLNEEAQNSKDYGELEGHKVDIRLINCERTHYLRWHNQRFLENNDNVKFDLMVAEEETSYNYDA